MSDLWRVPGRENNADAHSLHPAFRHRSSLALSIPLHHSKLLICLCSAQIQQLKSVVLWWVPCSAFIPSQLMSSGISEQPAMPSSPGFPAPLPACFLYRNVSCSLQGRLASLQCPCAYRTVSDRLGLLWLWLEQARGYFQGPAQCLHQTQGLSSPSVPGSTDLLRSWPAAGDAASPAGISVQPLGNVQRAGIQPSQSKQRNVPEPECRAKEKRSARVVEWEEGE